ncbi:hypothetical protein [Modestobacter italicus]|uniref:hypothetical protein n=1 Tax=Modestobacter italicus (strain DSM 44449 / CECT 9708 / BC 501) TaxID=2732864 RepID=UPI001C953A5B|nr:hypothetical protein [Modestobacter italicus]
MTTDLIPSPPATDSRTPRSAGSLLLPIAGGALIVGQLLYAAGMATSPPQDSMASADYVEALARDEGRTALSALLLHYGTLATGVGWLAAPALVRGRRGRLTTVAGALMAVLGMVSVAGMVLSDFWTGALGRELPADTAVSLFDTVQAAPGMAVVGTVTVLGLLGPLVVCAGLARAGVTGWWLLAPALIGLGLSFALTFSPLPYAALALLGAVPAVVVGLRMLQRARAGAA